MKISLGRVVILVHDYDEALAFYSSALNCIRLYDMTADNGQRFLHLGFEGEPAGIWLLKAATPEQLQRVGKQTHGPALVLYTDSFEDLHRQLVAHKVRVTKGPVVEPEYKFLHFLDLYGNEIVLVELKS
ncbi:MAG: VOC family protein [Bacteroidota bacterium]